MELRMIDIIFPKQSLLLYLYFSIIQLPPFNGWHNTAIGKVFYEQETLKSFELQETEDAKNHY